MAAHLAGAILVLARATEGAGREHYIRWQYGT
jgi:hypothetical protein